MSAVASSVSHASSACVSNSVWNCIVSGSVAAAASVSGCITPGALETCRNDVAAGLLLCKILIHFHSFSIDSRNVLSHAKKMSFSLFRSSRSSFSSFSL